MKSHVISFLRILYTENSSSVFAGLEQAFMEVQKLGGDCDTLTCIAAGIAEAFYGVPEHYREEVLSRIEIDMRHVYEDFGANYRK